MKNLLYLFLLPFISMAQENYEASRIISAINAGGSVNISGKKITGVLDLTELKNQVKSGNETNSEVEVSLTFKDCVFEADFIAYKNIEDKNGKYGQTYTTDFNEAVSFENCKFDGVFAAKYSKFSESVNFEGSYFSEEANFKYAKFKEKAVFGNVDFRSDANFKYANFKADADFYQNAFGGEANFKYAEFDERATFKRAVFSGLANFKYAEFDREGVFVNADFKGEADFKNTDGKIYGVN